MERKRNTEIQINRLFDPNSVHALEYVEDMSAVYRERLTDEDYLNSILANPEIDGAKKLVIEANDKAFYLFSGLDFNRRMNPDLYSERIDFLKEIANHSVFLMNESDSKMSSVAERFLNIYLYGRTNEILEEFYGPDFTSVYHLMLSNGAKTINTTVENLKQVPSLDHIGPKFEDRILEGIVKSFLIDQPRVIEKHIQNNFWKINQYLKLRSKNQPEDTPNLDTALIKFFVTHEDELIHSTVAENFDVDQLIAFKMIGEKVLDSIITERDSLTYSVDEDSGEIVYDFIPNPGKVIQIASWFGRRRNKK